MKCLSRAQASQRSKSATARQYDRSPAGDVVRELQEWGKKLLTSSIQSCKSYFLISVLAAAVRSQALFRCFVARIARRTRAYSSSDLAQSRHSICLITGTKLFIHVFTPFPKTRSVNNPPEAAHLGATKLHILTIALVGCPSSIPA